MRHSGDEIPTRHEAGPVTFAWGARLRDECWRALDPRVRDRLHQHAGEVICWWAADDPAVGRPSATVFGSRELCFATPSFDGERPVHLISGYLLDPASSRTYRIDPAQTSEAGLRSGENMHEVDIGLPEEVRGMLGNLPPRAQTLLQGPFTGGRHVESHGWHYEGDERTLNFFALYLAGAESITMATGTKSAPTRDPGGPAQWNLICRQARVIGHRGF
ncbi:hypothetical protein [Actinomadura chokoriensis]|uniref:hypothetical protein n=1 Tax=Actinomadura chokoriensis TaxID=454156 RepID=UPI0031F72D04